VPRQLRSGCFRPATRVFQVLASRAGRPQLEFRVLGPLEVLDGGCEVSLGGRTPRALLAVLLLHPNEVVSTDRLMDELWGEDSPERASATLRVNV
jgi:DNA-binding SARP family transcriptional activator